jgi:phage anti-repressor protein
MDISANPLDLIYFTNSSAYRKMNKKSEENNEEYNKDLLFYRKRILQKTKDLLRGGDCSADIEKGFKDYTKELIRHLKFTDKKDIIQDDYKNLGENNKSGVKINFKLETQNKLMMREKKNKEKGTIESCIDVKFKNKKVYKPYIPQKKVINLTLNDLKNKGVKNKSK